ATTTVTSLSSSPAPSERRPPRAPSLPTNPLRISPTRSWPHPSDPARIGTQLLRHSNTMSSILLIMPAASPSRLSMRQSRCRMTVLMRSRKPLCSRLAHSRGLGIFDKLTRFGIWDSSSHGTILDSMTPQDHISGRNHLPIPYIPK
ncbi:hypothetical protein MLD38_034542, partial [Melastoma candidum]